MADPTVPEADLADTFAEVIGALDDDYGQRVRSPRFYKGKYDSNSRFDDPQRGRLLAKVSSADLSGEVIDWQETALDAPAPRRRCHVSHAEHRGQPGRPQA